MMIYEDTSDIYRLGLWLFSLWSFTKKRWVLMAFDILFHFLVYIHGPSLSLNLNLNLNLNPNPNLPLYSTRTGRHE